jgi:hypothetical protein
MNTGYPAVSGEGAMDALEPPFPLDWPRTRRPTPEEWAGIQARRRRLEQEKFASRQNEEMIYD